MASTSKDVRDDIQHATDMAIIAAADAQLRDACDAFAEVLARTSDPIDLATLKDTIRTWIDRVMRLNVAAEQCLHDAQFLDGRR